MRPDRPSERIVIDADVVLRRHRLDDVDALHTVIEESRDHLRPFMPFADQARDDTAGFVIRSRSEWDAGTGFNYLITVPEDDAGEEQILGGIGLMGRGGEGTLEIGYWLRPSATGRGVITSSARRLIDVAAMLGAARVMICCDDANLPSAAVPRRLGFRLDHIESRPITAPGEHGRHMVWVHDAGGRGDGST